MRVRRGWWQRVASSIRWNRALGAIAVGSIAVGVLAVGVVAVGEFEIIVTHGGRSKRFNKKLNL